MPPAHPEDQFDRSLVKTAMDLKDAWVAGGPVEGTSVAQWKTAQTLVFLNALLQEEAAKAAMTADVLRKMNGIYNFTASGNAEIRFRWQKLCIRAEMEEIVPHVVKMVLEQGRMKFTHPVQGSVQSAMESAWQCKRSWRTRKYIILFREDGHRDLSWKSEPWRWGGAGNIGGYTNDSSILIRERQHINQTPW